MPVTEGHVVAEQHAEQQAGEQAGQQAGQQADGIDTSVAHPARVYDYWLGGTNNFPADREAAERVLAATPGLRFRVRANRAFLARAVRYLAGEAGITQFLDIGTGIPSADNTHQVAQAVAPDARVVYADNDRTGWGSVQSTRHAHGSNGARLRVRQDQHGQPGRTDAGTRHPEGVAWCCDHQDKH